MTVAVWTGVVLLGGIGAVLRFLVDRAVSKRVARPFPFGTLVVNLSGALLLGFFAGLALSPHVALLAGTAFVGSYTTFSTWMLETQRLGEERQVVSAFANIAVSVVLGLAAAWLGQCDRSRAVTDYLKLTAYFDERLRHGDRFLSDALLDLYGDNAVATSVVLRGIASFGPHHVLRSDQSLSLSEDSPIAVAAVDTADKMAGLADQVSAMVSRGLVTLERAHLGGSAPPPDAAKLTVYVGRQDRADGRPAYRAVCEVLHRHGFAGASVFLGVDGTARGQRKTGPLLQPQHGRAGDDHRGRNRRAGCRRAPRTRNAVARAAFHDRASTAVQTRRRSCWPVRRPCRPPMTAGAPLWQKLMVYTSEAELHDGTPIHRAIVRRLFESRAASGATVLRGIWGFHGDHEPHGDKLDSAGPPGAGDHDRRRRPRRGSRRASTSSTSSPASTGW